MLRDLLAQAHRNGLRGELLLSNWSSRVGDFDPALVTALLSEPAHRRAAVRRIARIARSDGWDGITVDLEAMHARDRDGLVALLRALRARLPARVELSMDIGARSSLARVPPLRLLAAHAVDDRRPDRADDLRPARSRLVRPGPDRGAALAAAHHRRPRPAGPAVDGRPRDRRLRLHLADQPGPGTRSARAAPGPSPTPTAPGRSGTRRIGEWSTTLDDGTVIWWSDGRSYRKRLALARDLGVHGVALWVLGSADPLP